MVIVPRKKYVWVEIDATENPVRIFRNRHAALELPQERTRLWPRASAVHLIREAILLRSQGLCESGCGRRISRDTGEMHEKVPRGKGGEISLVNSVFICRPCHTGPSGAHGDRRWQTSKLCVHHEQKETA